jgi:hypothetical protein
MTSARVEVRWIEERISIWLRYRGSTFPRGVLGHQGIERDFPVLIPKVGQSTAFNDVEWSRTTWYATNGQV